MKKFKKFLAILLVASMIFTTNAVNVFAEGMKANQEEQLNEEIVETSEETTVGAKLGEPALDEEEPEEEEITIEDELSEPEEEAEETTVGGEQSTGLFSVHGARPEDEEEEPEETTVVAKLGELEKIKANTEDKLFGYRGPIGDIEIIQQTTKTYHVGDTYDPSDLKIRAYYDDADTEDERMVEVAYTDDPSRFSFNPDCVNNPFTESTTEENPYELEIHYNDGDSGIALVITEFQVYPAPGPTTYTVTYNQNLPEGYDLSEGKIWYADATSDDLENDYIELEGNADMTCEDASGNVRTLEGWNTASGGAGTSYDFGEIINDATKFTEDTLDLYAVWSEPVAPGPTAFAYWIVDGDGDNKTIHYYASATDGDGRTAVDFDENGVVYTSLSDDERNSIKKAVFEEPIVATDVRSLFYLFEGLVSITDLGKLDTTSATSFKGMFDSCSAIEELDVSGLETNSLTNTSFMFADCSSLTKLTFGDYFDTSKVTTMVGMFYVCSQMTSVTFGSKFDTSNVTNMRNMFCSAGLEELDLTKFDTSNVTDMYGMFSSCENLETIRVSDKFVVDQVTSSNYMFFNTSNLVGEQGTKSTDTATPWDKTYAHIDEGTTNPGLFSGASTPTTYTVTYNKNLPEGYDLSEGKIWYDDETFPNAESIYTELNGSEDMTCEDATGISRKLLKWNTKVDGTGTEYNFADEIADATHFTEYKLILYAVWSEPAIPYMYWYVDEDDHTLHFTSKNEAGSTAIDFGEDGAIYNNLSKSNITIVVFDDEITATNVRRLFDGFEYLTTVDNLDKFDTSQVTDFSYMFNGCTSLEELDLRSLDTAKATNMTSMFADDGVLEIIRVSDKFVVDNVTESEKMFNGCIKIEGERGTVYDSDKIDIEYAHIDGGTANPGYLSGAPARSTLDTSGTPKLYVVAYDGTDATKKIYSVDKTAGESALANILDNLNLPDPTASVTGYYVINGAAKDSDGHRVFLNEDDLKNRYGEAKIFDPDNDKTRDGLLSEYQNYATITEVYDLYFGVCYSPFISEIIAVDGISLDKFDELAYFEEKKSLNIENATITVKYTDGSEQDIKYTDDPDNFSVEPAVFKLGDSSVAIKYKTLSYAITDNMYVWQNSDQWMDDVYKIEGVQGYRKVYVEGEKFDPTNLEVNTEYSFANPGVVLGIPYLDRNKNHWKIEDKVLSLTDTSVKIQVGGYSGATFDVPIEVVRKGLSATIDAMGQKNYYIDGDYIGNNDRNGLTVTITYSSDPTPVSYTYPTDKDYFTFNPGFNNKVTTNDDKISMIVAGMKLDYSIVVLPDDTPTAAVREKDPDKTQYVAVTDNHFDPYGLKIKLTYPGGITKIVECTSETIGKFTFDPDVSADLDPSIKNIKVSFDGSPEVEFPITVRKEIKNISYVSGPDNNIYSVGDKFDPTGLVIKITYVDDEEEEIPYNSTTASGFSFGPPLDFIFEDHNIGEKVEVTFGQYMPLVPIDNTEILGEGFSFISADNTTGDIALLPNITNRDDLDQLLNAAISQGAIGFHIISANGINDAKKKYNKYTASTLTKDAVLAEFDNYAGGFVFVGASFKSPTPTPKPPTPTPTYSNDSGSDSSSGGGGPAISGNNKINIFTVNNIPLSSMLYNPALYLQLMSYPQNINMQKTNALDVYGHTGFGRWLRVPNTTTWYFYAGDFNNNTNNSGFLKDGWFNLGWDGVDRWYRFDSNGVMQLGWYEENGKIYFLQNDLNDNWYGKALTGTHVIDGKTYTFDSTGALIQ